VDIPVIHFTLHKCKIIHVTKRSGTNANELTTVKHMLQNQCTTGADGLKLHSHQN